jgi:hypothetical protein
LATSSWKGGNKDAAFACHQKEALPHRSLSSHFLVGQRLTDSVHQISERSTIMTQPLWAPLMGGLFLWGGLTLPAAAQSLVRLRFEPQITRLAVGETAR